jgi:acyl transferase domain-containing protein/phosphopantetheinyl transferase (holo-ACP synthase)
VTPVQTPDELVASQTSTAVEGEVISGGEPIAIIGMSCRYPGSPDVATYWRNILDKVESISDPDVDTWDPEVYFDPTFTDKDKSYVKRGGYLGPVKFDPLPHGIPPINVGGEPDQWIALQLAHEAMEDAGCLDLPEAIRRKAGIILGKGTYLNGGNAVAVQRALVVGQTIDLLKKLDPDYPEELLEVLRAELKAVLPPVSAETVAGLVPNVMVGRIANRMDLMGPAFTVDAACASSLLAMQLAMRDLRSGAADLMIAGGSQVWMPVPTLNVFCHLGALAKSGRVRPFDASADGTLLGEGIGMVVLKRLSDAERDGDRIYSVLRGVGVASDGRGVGVMAPRVDGEELALQRAYADAGVDPSTVGLIEAHGTATAVGDVVEVQALRRMFGERAGERAHIALGSVKSMISHTIPAAGVAGVIKTSLALYHRVLPPTLGVEEPNPKLELETSPFYLNTETRPWISASDGPRRAGVNAFGFGGINAHAVLEEYVPTAQAVSTTEPATLRYLPEWPTELVILTAPTVAELLAETRELAAAVSEAADVEPAPYRLADLAATYARRLAEPSTTGGTRLAIVASSLADLAKKLGMAADRLATDNCKKIKHASGIYFTTTPLAADGGKLAFLFPGEGAQYPGMLADLCLQFPEVREVFDRADRVQAATGRTELPSDLIYPQPVFDNAARLAAEAKLMELEPAVDSVLIADAAVFALLDGLGLKPDVSLGHSSGEYAAAIATGVLAIGDSDDLIGQFSKDLRACQARGEASGDLVRAALLAAAADRGAVEALAAELNIAFDVALDNCPHQTVVAGAPDEIERLRAEATKRGMICEVLDFDRAVHTQAFQPYADELREVFTNLPFGEPANTLISCATGQPYPTDDEQLRRLFADQWALPVEFRRTIEKLHDDGVRLFVEVGPRGNLTAFADDILRGKPYLAVATDSPRRHGITALNHLVAQLSVHGVQFDVAGLFAHREVQDVDWRETAAAPRRPSRPLLLLKNWPTLDLSEEALDRVRRPASLTSRQSASTAGTEPDPAASTGSTSANGAAPALAPETFTPETAAAPETTTPEPAAAQLAGAAPAAQTLAPVGASPGTRAAGPDRHAVVHSHLTTMEQFLQVNEQVLGSYLRGGGSRPSNNGNGVVANAPRPAGQPRRALRRRRRGAVPTPADHPMLGQLMRWQHGSELVARRVIDPNREPYFRDHAFGRGVATFDPALTGFAVVPLTMSMEILAEAGTCLLPGFTVIGLVNVQANRWIASDGEAQLLEITAQRLPSEAGIELVRVEIRNLTEDPDPTALPAVAGTVRLGPNYPEPPSELTEAPPADEASRWTPERLYVEGMFHGPSWQGVSSVDTAGPGGTSGTMNVLSFDGLMEAGGRPEFVLDPIVLDAAGQLAGFWTAERFEAGQIVFPFYCEAVELYGPLHGAGEVLRGDVRVRQLSDAAMSSDIDVVGADGQLWMRLKGWADKRFDAPIQLRALLADAPLTMSNAWAEPVHALGSQDDDTRVHCRRLHVDVPTDRAFWIKVWAGRVLSRTERAEFGALRIPPARQLEWLAGRTAAKEAVVHLLQKYAGLDVHAADIELLTNPDGRVVVSGSWLARITGTPVVSISHAAGQAVGLAVWAHEDANVPHGVGIDLTHVGPPHLTLENGSAFSDGEQALLATLPVEQLHEWTLRCSAAKDAVANALGSGSDGDSQFVTIVAVDPASGRITTELRGTLRARYPHLADRRLLVHSLEAGDVVVATTQCAEVEPASAPTRAAGL